MQDISYKNGYFKYKNQCIELILLGFGRCWLIERIMIVSNYEKPAKTIQGYKMIATMSFDWENALQVEGILCYEGMEYRKRMFTTIIFRTGRDSFSIRGAGVRERQARGEDLGEQGKECTTESRC